MPIYAFRCEEGHEYEMVCLHSDDKGCRTAICDICQSSMAPVMSLGQGLCYFEEGRTRRIWNLERSDERDRNGNLLPSKPVYVRSHEEHKRLMRQQKVDFATRGRGIKGQWI